VHMHFYRKPKRFGGFKNLDTKSEKSVDKFLSSQGGDVSRASPSPFSLLLVCILVYCCVMQRLSSQEAFS
jgi:hypothetical protein